MDAQTLKLELIKDMDAQTLKLELIKEMEALEALDALSFQQLVMALERGADLDSALDACGNTAIHLVSTLLGSLPCVKMLVENGADVNVENGAGQTPLHLASSYGNVDTVRFLLAKNALVNRQDKAGATPLHLAAQCTSEDRGVIIELLLDSGAEIKGDEQGRTALYYIWRNKTDSLLEFLLERGLGDNVLDSHDNTMLHFAVRRVEDERFVKSLLDKGVSVNRRNEFGQTALHRASKHSDGLDIVKLLVERGADMSIEDCSGETALVYAIQHDNYGVINYLIDKGANVNCTDSYGNTGIHTSAIKDSKILFDLLFQAGASVNEVNNDGNTPLHLAVAHCAHGDASCMLKTFLSTNVDVNLKNNIGLTAFHLALHLNELEHAYLLLERTSNTDVCDEYGNTIIHKAVLKKSTDLLQKLISKGENLYCKNHQRMTALHLAVVQQYKIGVHMFLANEIKGTSGESLLFKSILKRDKSSLRRLLNDNNNLNYKDSIGRNALHWAVLRGFSFGVNLLIKKGVDVNEKDLFGNTVLHLAVLMDRKDILIKLLSNGADINLQDKDRRTALHFVAFVPHTNSACMLIYDIHYFASYEPIFYKLTEIIAECLFDIRDCDGNTPLHLAMKNENCIAVEAFLNWGARTDIVNNAGESLISSISTCDFLTKAIVFKQIVRVKEAKLETYNFGLNLHECERILTENWQWRDIVLYLLGDTFEKELNEMLTLKMGRFHIYDVFTLKNLSFVLDEDLKLAIFSIFSQMMFPLYWQMLQAKFLRSKVRYRRINECVRFPLLATVDNLNEVHLPVEIKLMIFNLLSDEDLFNVISCMREVY